ncbi:KCTD3, partial [Cordylochernes scorpioides]
MIFIDRDPKLFCQILNFMRTKDIDVRNVDIGTLRHEAEFYGIGPLVKRLTLCEDLNHSSCGDVLFHGWIPPPVPVVQAMIIMMTRLKSENQRLLFSWEERVLIAVVLAVMPQPPAGKKEPEPPTTTTATNKPVEPQLPAPVAVHSEPRPGTIFRVQPPHSRNPSLDLRHLLTPRSSSDVRGHSRASSLDLHRHSSRPDLGFYFNSLRPPQLDSRCLRSLCKLLQVGAASCIVEWVVAIWCRLRDSTGWQLAFTTPHMDAVVERIALNAKMAPSTQAEVSSKMLALSYGAHVCCWRLSDDGASSKIGVFNLHVPVDHLFFIGSQLVGLSHTGKVGVWHAMTQHWQIQDVVPVTSYDTAGSFLLLGCNNGSIYYIGEITLLFFPGFVGSTW